jgi:choline dehydrogenase-like flavoprotein
MNDKLGDGRKLGLRCQSIGVAAWLPAALHRERAIGREHGVEKQAVERSLTTSAWLSGRGWGGAASRAAMITCVVYIRDLGGWSGCHKWRGEQSWFAE